MGGFASVQGLFVHRGGHWEMSLALGHFQGGQDPGLPRGRSGGSAGATKATEEAEAPGIPFPKEATSSGLPLYPLPREEGPCAQV